jgi:hypothetical protein
MKLMTMRDFRVGDMFQVHVQGTNVPMRLEAAQELPMLVRQGGSFRLEFRGPPQPALLQGIYPFQKGSEAYNLFIVPIRSEPKGVLYEAIFN